MDGVAALSDPSLPTVVQFHAKWCSPCKAIAPRLAKLEAEYSGRVAVRRVDVDLDEASARAMGVRGVPTLVALRGDREVERISGMAEDGRLRRLFEVALEGDAGPSRPFEVPWKGIAIAVGIALTLLPRWVPEAGAAKWAGLALVVWGLRDACPLCALGTRGVAGAFGRIARPFRKAG